jgi:prophage maintenance system killer protein
MDTFLRVNGYELTADEFELENMVIETATGKLSKANIAEFLEQNSQKRSEK